MHVMEGVIDLVQRLSMGDELVNFQTALLPILNKTWQLRSSLDTTKGTALPLTPSHKLEWSR
jgi:hypothetical protein